MQVLRPVFLCLKDSSLCIIQGEFLLKMEFFLLTRYFYAHCWCQAVRSMNNYVIFGSTFTRL